jgi:hypothetical protein
MKWLDYGQIFNVNEYGIEYSKAPQALVFDDFVRIYFSACKPDTGKLISYVCYVDFDKSFSKILNFSDSVISDGKLGCFDEHGIFPFSPTKTDYKIYGYTSGVSRRVSVSVDSGIGVAVSNDGGNTFLRLGDGPILTSSLHEPFLVIDGFVRKYDGKFHMWYIFGTQWKKYTIYGEPERIYRIAHATSSDGLQWTKSNRQIIKSHNENEAQALPCVIEWGNKYNMMFCYRNAYDFRNNPQHAYKLGYAFSHDLENWTRDDNLAFSSQESFANEMICYPNLFECSGKLYLLYNGNQFGRFGFGLAKLED